HAQAVQEGQQRQRLAQFVTGAPEHLAAGFRRVRDGGSHPRGLSPAAAPPPSADLPMPGSPSMSTEPPCPRATAFMSPVSSAISLSRPTSAPAGLTGCMQRTLLL